MILSESKFIYKNIQRKQKIIDCLEFDKENNLTSKSQEKNNKILNTQEMDSIMNQTILSYHDYFQKSNKNPGDSISSIENLITRLNKVEYIIDSKEINSDDNKIVNNKNILTNSDKFNKNLQKINNVIDTINDELGRNPNQKLSTQNNEQSMVNTFNRHSKNTISIDKNSKQSLLSNLKLIKKDKSQTFKTIKHNEEANNLLINNDKIDNNLNDVNNNIINNITLINTNPLNLVKFLKNSNSRILELNKDLKIFNDFLPLKGLKKNISTQKTDFIQSQKVINKIHPLTRNSNSVNNLLLFPSTIRQDSKLTSNKIFNKDQKDNFFMTMTKFDTNKVDELYTKVNVIFF